jgi:hypothetical protein
VFCGQIYFDDGHFMTSDFDAPAQSEACADQDALEEAKPSSNLQLAVGGNARAGDAGAERSRVIRALTEATIHPFTPKQQASPQVPEPMSERQREFAISVMIEAALTIAVTKNVCVKRESLVPLCTATYTVLGETVFAGLLQDDSRAIADVAATLNRLLDTVAATQVVCMLWQVEGCQEVDMREMALRVAPWIEEPIANDLPVRSYRWPTTEDMVCNYYGSRSWWPVTVTLPEGRKPRATWRIHPAACKNPDSVAPHFAPPLVKCPGLPGTLGAVMPDGRCFRKLPDGPAVQSYWKNGKLHREDGPAYVEQNFATGIRREEHWLDGTLHRPSVEGPAVIETDAAGRTVTAIYIESGKRHRAAEAGPAFVGSEMDGERAHVEEYYWEGEWHRPAEAGPAVRVVEPSGKVLYEIFFEAGRLHRDPAEGPAWHEDKSGIVERRYVDRGLLHRDERDGPAVVVTDTITGVILREEYYRNGSPHREQGPAFVTRHPDGSPFSESWCRDGEANREDGPAITFWWTDGSPRSEAWFFRDRLLRAATDGPAYRRWNEQGELVQEEYWVNGEMVAKDATPSNRRRRCAEKSRTRKARKSGQVSEAVHV